MAKLQDWIADSRTLAVTTDSSLVPKFFVSPIGPSASDLFAVANKELSDGWPAAVVDRCTLRRKSMSTLYVGPSGLSIGPLPAEDICPSLGRISRRIRQPRGVRFFWQPDEPSSAVYARARKIWTDHFAEDTAVVGFIKNRLLNDGTVTFVSTLYAQRNAGRDMSDGLVVFEQACAADIDDQYLHVGFHLWLGAADVGGDSSNHGSSITIVMRFTKGDWKGVRGMWYSPQYAQSKLIFNTAADVRGWTIGRMYVDSGFKYYLGRWFPSLRVNTDSIAAATVPARNQNTMSAFVYTECIEMGIDPREAVSWWEQPQSLFESRHGLWHRDVYTIGNPEFVNRFTALGNSSDGYRTVINTTLGFEWDGSRLSDMNPSMSAADREQVSKLYIATVVHPDKLDPGCRLDDLYVEQLHIQNEKTVAEEVFKKAMTANDETLPAMNFREAIVAANQVDDTVWHRQSLAESEITEIDLVRITGTTDNTVVSSYDGSVLVSQDPGYGLVAYMLGAELDTYSWVPGLTNDPIREAWDVTQFDLDNNTDKLRIRLEFDENYVYGYGLPLRGKLSRGERTAMLMLHGAMSRKQYSSFVVGSAVMAANARRLLT